MTGLAAVSTWDRPFAPMGPTAARVAAYWFRLNAEWERVAATRQPVGLLVGEQPPPAGNPALPLWPYPATSAGGRLRAMSGVPAGEYLMRLARVNLSRRPVATWDTSRARHRAHQLLATLPDGARVVLCGARARDAALGQVPWFEAAVLPATRGHVVAVAIPHPSGRAREYNDPDNRDRAGQAVRWAAGLED